MWHLFVKFELHVTRLSELQIHTSTTQPQRQTDAVLTFAGTFPWLTLIKRERDFANGISLGLGLGSGLRLGLGINRVSNPKQTNGIQRVGGSHNTRYRYASR